MNKSSTIASFILNEVLNEDSRLSKTSIDDQVDSILLRFESDCIVGMVGEDDVNEAVLLISQMIVEAPGDEEEEATKPKAAFGSPQTDAEKEVDIEKVTDDVEDSKPDEEADPLQPKIDLRKFAGKVSRLATNYDALLNMPTAIVNRAKNYLEQNYNKAVADEFIEIVKNEFDIDVGDTSISEPREKPIATGAAASGLG